MDRMRTWRSWLLKKALGGGTGLSWAAVVEHELEESSWLVLPSASGCMGGEGREGESTFC